MNLHLEEVYEDIQQAYKEGLVNDLFVDFKEVEETYALGKETVLKDLQNDRYYQLIDNAIEEMQAWVSFEPSEQPIPPMKLIKEEPAPRYSEPRKGPKIGRNDPCPCGSGKKYKKCCLK